MKGLKRNELMGRPRRLGPPFASQRGIVKVTDFYLALAHPDAFEIKGLWLSGPLRNWADDGGW